MAFKPKFWRPGSDTPGEAATREDRPDKGEGTAAIYNRYGSLSLDKQRERLPIYKYRSHIIYLLEKYQILILIGETGCGKSTQLPQYLLECGWASGGRAIAITQPRRVAVISVATRIADERGSIIGGEIGYAVRFDASCDPMNTKVKFMTDGLLIRELMSDPLLTKYSVVIVDEAHERSLNTDILIGLLKKIAKKRPELRIIIASATLDAQLFLEYFNLNKNKGGDSSSVALTVEGRMYPVKVHYSLEPVANYLETSVSTCIAIHKRYPASDGDVLIFLTGQDEVEHVIERLIDYARSLTKEEDKLNILAMYGGLPAKEQFKVFERTPRRVRKVVVATNIAEASVTIPGVCYVIDCGFVKLRAFNPRVGVESLVVVATSRSSAEQRAGRAGRVRAGQVYRLYQEHEFTTKLRPQTVPEMQRSDMSSVVLQLKALGIDNIVRFPFLSSPPAQNMVRGVQLLYALGALDEECLLTPLGNKMAELPMHPTSARMILASDELHCSEEIATIAAMMQIQSIYDTSQGRNRQARHRRRFAVEEGDHVSMLNVYSAFLKYGKTNKQWCGNNGLNFRGMQRAVEIRNQLCRLITGRGGMKLRSCGDDVQKIQKAIVYGYFGNAARYHPSGEYRTLRDQQPLSMHPTSVLSAQNPPPKVVVFSEVLQTSKDFMRDITVIDPEWLYTLAPHYYSYGTARERQSVQVSKIRKLD